MHNVQAQLAIKPETKLLRDSAPADDQPGDAAPSEGGSNSTLPLLPRAHVGSIGSMHAHLTLLQQWLATNNASSAFESAPERRPAALGELAMAVQALSVAEAGNEEALHSREASASGLAPAGRSSSSAGDAAGPRGQPLLLQFEADAVLEEDFVPRLQALLEHVRGRFFDGINLWPPNYFCRPWIRDGNLPGPHGLSRPGWTFHNVVGTLWSLHGVQKVMMHLPSALTFDIYLQVRQKPGGNV